MKRTGAYAEVILLNRSSQGSPSPVSSQVLCVQFQMKGAKHHANCRACPLAPRME